MEDTGKTCEEEMIKLAEEKEREEKEEKLREEKEKDEENEKVEEESPTTAGEKRPLGESPSSPPTKKLCTEGETSSLACEVSSTSLQNSNGSSTSTKPVVVEEAMDGTDLLKLAEKAETAEKAAEEAEKEATKEDEDKDKTSNAVETVETEAKSIGAESAKTAAAGEEDMATKLLASGISVSLIKKKKAPISDGVPAEVAKDKTSGDKEGGNTALEIGPNISVTMIQKEKAGQKSGLTVRSPGELLETPKSKVAPQLEDLKDSISVSRVHKTPASSPRPPHLAPQAPLPPHPMFGLPMGMAGPMGPPPGPVPGPMGMPGLHPRPGVGPALRPQGPLAQGPVSEQLKAAAGSLADYMRMGLEDLLREMSAKGSPQATIKGLQLEIEKMAWRHSQEMAEMKQSVEIMMKEMKTNIEKENQRAVEQYRKAAEAEKQKAIVETKKKQWCANCTKEAIFYCCWNTSYCDYPCQQAHWPSHLSTCSQANQDGEEGGAPAATPSPPQDKAPPAPQPPQPQVLSPEQLVSMAMPRQGQVMGLPPGFSMAGMAATMAGMRPQFGMPRASMGLSIRPGVPGQLTISRPYFM